MVAVMEKWMVLMKVYRQVDDWVELSDSYEAEEMGVRQVVWMGWLKAAKKVVESVVDLEQKLADE